MPLLRKQVFERQALPEYLRDDEEVFYCEITNEIFRDYQDFSERMFLCNSMVWTCSLTGKSHLTYQEAMESEEHAKQSLKEFPNELKLPILYLASLTKRTSFGDMAEDVYLYAKDRHFVGENVETTFGSNKWKDCQILSVVCPKGVEVKPDFKNGSSPERHFVPSASSYKYEIEHLDSEDKDISEIMIVNSGELRRKKQYFTREKCKLFLKQCIQQDEQGIFTLKQDILEQFSLKSVRWEHVFDGPLPNFQTSKKLEKTTNGLKKKQKQETLTKYLKRNGLTMKGDGEKDNNVKRGNLLEQMKKREEEFKIKKQMNDEQKAAIREEKKYQSNVLEQQVKMWMARKEDLELEDQVKLPVGAPVNMKIPDLYFGDVLSIMEFLHTFSSFLSVEDFFPQGFTLDVMERALCKVEIAGPFADAVLMLLTAIFNLQEVENSNYSTPVENIKDEENLPVSPKDLREAALVATLAAKNQKKCYGVSSNKLPVHNLTLSEVLRLHLLTSGARLHYSGTRWRSALRGGYASEDDPALHLMINEGHILKNLAVRNVVQFPIGDKVKILSCLTNQLLTYTDLRETLDEKIEKAKKSKFLLKTKKALESKRVHKYITDKKDLRNQLKGDKVALDEALLKLQEDNEIKQAKAANKIRQLLIASSDWRPLLGRDRAYRQYLRIESVPGLFINWEDELAGHCLDKVTVQYPELVNANRSQIRSHIKKTHGLNGDKENTPSPKKINGARSVLEDNQASLLMCTANVSTCPVHNVGSKRVKWSFLHDKEQLFDLIKSLNKRGIRESNLKEYVCGYESNLVNLIEKTPVAILNPELDIERGKKETDEGIEVNGHCDPESRPEDAFEELLLEHILDMELKINQCKLSGTVGILGREQWRNCLKDRDYDRFEVLWQEEVMKSRLDFSIMNKDKQENDSSEKHLKLEENESLVKTESLEYLSDVSASKVKKVIRSLACALLRLAYCIPAKYLKQPLGNADHKNNKATDVHNSLANWEESVRIATSFSQMFLLYDTLDSCIVWPKLYTQRRCQICRRENASDSILKCDGCNLVQHMACLKSSKMSIRSRTNWFCDKCKIKAKLLGNKPAQKPKEEIFLADEEEEEENVEEESSKSEDESDADVKIDLCKTCGSGGEIITCDECSIGYHKECVDPPLRRFPRHGWTCTSCSNLTKQDVRTRDKLHRNGYYKETDSGDEFNKSSSRRANKGVRREDAREDLPLNNAALQDLLAEVMKHKDAWPFVRKVQKNEVPDYFDIITNPMDFGTIKNKLNMGEYSTDSQVMKDIALIFENCNTYNSSSDEVYKCGEKLLNYVSTQAKKYGFKVPRLSNQDEPRVKKRRYE
ncbi:bromodomain adjacent to zinc finger domain protein 1A isoform X2 [Cylas formicarius]|uniref:bromodomain adjacent to zinc finger domain protein 1A isoform X2 n=1 Tax=Cylas formicarius TaxID=197179 RepID=UPI0029586C61|nr:bromodomain adjacent to zinc finger domain protein 1A isoform X2 [Cylas formicarius]